MLSNQDVSDSGYFFYESGLKTCFVFAQGSLSSRPEPEREETLESYHAGYEKLLDFLGEAEKKVSHMLKPRLTIGRYGTFVSTVR